MPYQSNGVIKVADSNRRIEQARSRTSGGISCPPRWTVRGGLATNYFLPLPAAFLLVSHLDTENRASFSSSRMNSTGLTSGATATIRLKHRPNSGTRFGYFGAAGAVVKGTEFQPSA